MFLFFRSMEFCNLCVRKFNRSDKNTMNFDDFIQCCVMLKSLTDAFRKHDHQRTGVVTINYEQVISCDILTVLPFRFGTANRKLTILHQSQRKSCHVGWFCFSAFVFITEPLINFLEKYSAHWFVLTDTGISYTYTVFAHIPLLGDET